MQQTIRKTRLIITSIAIGAIVSVGSLGAALVQSSPAHAGQATQQPAAAVDKCAPAAIVSFPHWYDGICENGSIKSPNDVPGGLPKFITIIAMNIVTIILMIVGYVSLAFIIWGGFKFMYSGDNSSGVAAARKTILNAVIGLVLSIMSVAIVKVIGGAIS